jgi:hypothetical protein
MRVKYPTPGGLPSPTKPFGSINVEKNKKTKEITVTAQVLLDKLPIEGAEFGLALDGSASMIDSYGTESGPFGFGTPNYVEPVAKSMLKFLAQNSKDGDVEFAYWAVGPGGREIEEVGKVLPGMLDTIKIYPKKNMGGSTYLMPIIDHMVNDKLRNASWAMAVIVTDGRIDDIEDVQKWTEQFAVDVHSGKRVLVKLVLIGLGKQVDTGQLEKLDDFVATVDVDIWSAKLAAEMEQLEEVFDEVMSEELKVAPSGKIIDNSGRILRVYNDFLPAKMRFKINPKSTGFKLEMPGAQSIEQDLTVALDLLK